MGGLATNQPTPEKPIVIGAVKTQAIFFPGLNESVVTGLLVQNLGTRTLNLYDTKISNVDYYYITSSEPRMICYFGDSSHGVTGIIEPGKQKICSIIHEYGSGSSYNLTTTTFSGNVAFYGNQTSSVTITLSNDTIGNITYYGSGGGGGIGTTN